MIRATVTKALEGHTVPLSGREVSTAANLPYKATIDALTHLHDNGIVVRFGRTYRAKWALAGSPAARQPDPLGAIEAAWRSSLVRRNTPGGGGRLKTPGALQIKYRLIPQKFFRPNW